MDILLPFRHPWMLAFLVLPLLLLIWIWRRRGRGVTLPLDHGIVRSGLGLRLLIHTAESVPALILAVVILILAGPQKWDEPKARKVMTNIEFCVDVSGSMTAQFGEGTRYDASMEAINGFLDFREGDAFGLTFFGNSVLHWVPLTNDVSAFRCAPPFMIPGKIPPWFGGTEIGKALLACRRVLLEREEGDRMIILISDGYSSDLAGRRAEEITQSLIKENIVVYGVHIGSSSPPEEIVKITSLTGGEVFSPGDQEGLAGVFKKIDEMAETKIEKVRTEAVDNFGFFAQIGLGLLALASLALFGLRFTPW